MVLVHAGLQGHFKDAALTQDALMDREALSKSLCQLLAVIRHFGTYLSMNDHPQLQSSIRELARDVDLGARNYKSRSMLTMLITHPALDLLNDVHTLRRKNEQLEDTTRDLTRL